MKSPRCQWHAAETSFRSVPKVIVVAAMPKQTALDEIVSKALRHKSRTCWLFFASTDDGNPEAEEFERWGTSGLGTNRSSVQFVQFLVTGGDTLSEEALLAACDSLSGSEGTESSVRIPGPSPRSGNTEPKPTNAQRIQTNQKERAIG
ncbi:unnamed protein product [Dibothriocephalus latus]|uniref:Uncharacterized protein n=1 Tax=Dibothriocephalus latus TaxID=60516 RepID=A0A3P7R0F0_DIBLA|nr:unnamed protein product [Dibothriocephalus latus]